MAARPVLHAGAAGGLPIAVLDVTHPDFALDDDPAALAALSAACAEEDRRNRTIPRPLGRLLFLWLRRRSRLLRALMEPKGDFLDGMTTYLMKLGPEHLPPGFDRPLDRKIAGSSHGLVLRLRLQQVAKLLAEGIAPHLAAAPGAPLVLVDIAGGASLDALNALILLRRQDPRLLERRVKLKVLDLEPAGPAFGAAALAALSAGEAPLVGVDVSFEHVRYDWTDTRQLEALVAAASAEGAVMAATSEGGLFEYGDDVVVEANLRALHRAAAVVVGSVTGASAERRRNVAEGPFRLIPRGAAGIEPLAARSGYRLARVEPLPLSDQVRLERV